MKSFRTFLAMTVIAAFFALATPSFAQQDNDRDRMKANQATITGCLAKADSGGWVITDPSGNKLVVTGEAEFDKHVNHVEKVTGTPSPDGKSFIASKIEHVSDSCPAK